jgi:hypothetical protein
MPAIFDERTPTWEALRLARHLTGLKIALVPYFVLLVCFWLHVLGVWRLQAGLLDTVGWGLALTYLFLVAETFYIQKVMHDSAVYKHGAWQVVVGAACLNPCVFGWWMPLSVLWVAARVRGQLEALEMRLQAEGRPRNLAGGVAFEPRSAGVSWRLSPKAAIVSAIVALLVLFFLWHFATIQKVR